MAGLDILLVVVTGICILAGALLRIGKRHNKIFRFISIIPFIVAAIHYGVCNGNIFIYITYLGTVLCGVCFFVKKNTAYYILSGIAMVANLAVVVMYLFGIRSYMALSYVESFDKLVNDMRQSYAMTGYKDIDWDEIYDEHVTLIEKAEKLGDKELYINTMVDFAGCFNDGHIEIFDVGEYLGTDEKSQLKEVISKRFNCNFGMTMIKLDSGQYIAVNVTAGGAAYNAGIREGNVIKLWNGSNPDVLAENSDNLIPVECRPFADIDNVKRYAPFYLTCMGEEKVTVVYIDSEGIERTAELESTGNGYEYLTDCVGKFGNRVNNGALDSDKEESVNFYIADNFCYININDFGGEPESYTKVMDDIAVMSEESGVDKILVDMRNNRGGFDDNGAEVLSYFIEEDMVYLKESTYNPDTDSYVVERVIEVKAKKAFDADIVVLINSQCMSAGEGFVYRMSELDNVTVLGISGTNGSMSTCEGFTTLPENIVIRYPVIPCLDEYGQVIVDSDAGGNGGVDPDVRIPLDENAARIMYTTDADYELDYAVEYLMNTKE